MEWLRLWHDTLHKNKTQSLPPPLFKHWINLLIVASENEPRGVLPSKIADISFALRVDEEAGQAIIDELVRRELLDLLPDGELSPHDWDEMQPSSDDVTARVRRHRERKSNKKPNVTLLQETLPKRYCNENETPQIRLDAEQRREEPPLPPEAGGAPSSLLDSHGRHELPGGDGEANEPEAGNNSHSQKPRKSRTVHSGPAYRPEGAARVYEAFPNKVDRPRFNAEWDILRPSEDDEKKMLDQLAAYGNLRADERSQCVMPYIYLKGERYNDADPFPKLTNYRENRNRNNGYHRERAVVEDALV